MGRIYLIAAVLAVMGTLLGAAYYKGRTDGVHAESLRTAIAIDELNEQLAEKDKELADLEAARLEQMRELEDRVEALRELANEDPHADRPAMSADSMRRLNTITGN